VRSQRRRPVPPRPFSPAPIGQDRRRASGRHTAPLVEVLEMNY